ncbi:MAG: DUF6804 family protein [Verrucomicrobiales bacterium]
MMQTTRFLPYWVLIAAAVFSFVAIADLPYGFYRLLRWVACGVAIASAVQLHINRHSGWVWALGIVALIFNPLIPFHFSKDTWRILDFGAGALFVVTLWITRQDEQRANKARLDNPLPRSESEIEP